MKNFVRFVLGEGVAKQESTLRLRWRQPQVWEADLYLLRPVSCGGVTAFFVFGVWAL